MNYIQMPTLQHVALTTQAIDLWKREDFSKLHSTETTPCLMYPSDMEEKAREIVSPLPLPNQFKGSLALLVEAIGTEMVYFFDHLYKCYGISRENAADLRWTPQGTIDARRSAENVLFDESLNLVTRFELACDYCLLEHIPYFWWQMEPQQRSYVQDYSYSFLVSFWSTYVTQNEAELLKIVRRNGKEDDGLSVTQCAFKHALFNHNTIAAKFFFEHLSSEEQNQWVFSLVEPKLDEIIFDFEEKDAPRSACADLLCFLLSKMSDGQRAAVLRKCQRWALPCFLLFPYHSFFLDSVNLVREFLSEEDFYYLLMDVYYKINHGNPSCPFRDVYLEFWRSSSVSNRKYVIQQRDYWDDYVLGRFLKDGEEGICKAIMADVAALGNAVCSGMEID